MAFAPARPLRLVDLVSALKNTVSLKTVRCPHDIPQHRLLRECHPLLPMLPFHLPHDHPLFATWSITSRLAPCQTSNKILISHQCTSVCLNPQPHPSLYQNNDEAFTISPCRCLWKFRQDLFLFRFTRHLARHPPHPSLTAFKPNLTPWTT